MADYTHEITMLQRARIDMQTEKAANKVSIKAKYAERIRQEIADADVEAEIRFARLLAEAHAAGVPQSLLRSEVLRTNVWSRWTYWRDLAEITPDRTVLIDRKEETRRANAVYRWDEADTEFGYALVLTKDEEGQVIEPEAVLTNIYEEGGVLVAWPDLSLHRDVWKKHWKDNGSAMKAYASKLATAHRKEIGK